MPKITTIVISTLFLLIAGCASTAQQQNIETQETQKSDGCKYMQRNLTVNWSQRSYWCVPNK